MIRDTILELLQREGHPPELKDVGDHIGIPVEEVKHRLSSEAPLAKLHDVSFEEARRLIAFYEPALFFSEDVISAVNAYFENRKRLESFERKARKRTQNPPDDDSKPT
jgi:hypothetical protein